MKGRGLLEGTVMVFSCKELRKVLKYWLEQMFQPRLETGNSRIKVTIIIARAKLLGEIQS